MRRTLIAAILLLLPFGVPAATVSGLYEASTLVTGTTEVNRLPGFGRCLVDVLIKVSGDLGLREDPRVASLAADAPLLVRGYGYRDLLAGLPIHDEQGSRDRPHELTVAFDPAGVDAALEALGRRPWGAERPRIAVFLAIRRGAARFVLARDGTRGLDEREALAAAAQLRGLPVVLPDAMVLADAGITPDAVADDRPRLEAAAARAGGEVALAGTMTWDEAAPGWVGEWQLLAPAGQARWETRIATFDATFRDALGGAAQILAGYGQPRSR